MIKKLIVIASLLVCNFSKAQKFYDQPFSASRVVALYTQYGDTLKLSLAPNGKIVSRRGAVIDTLVSQRVLDSVRVAMSMPPATLYADSTQNTYQIPNLTNAAIRVVINPLIPVANYTVYLPTAPRDGQNITIFFGGRFPENSPLIDMVQIIPPPGWNNYGKTPATAIVSGDIVLFVSTLFDKKFRSLQ